MEKLIKSIEISDNDKRICYDTIEWLLDFSYENFKMFFRENKLSRVFLHLWILKNRETKAKDLREKLKNTHWKEEFTIKQENRHMEKLSEINFNKNRFLKEWKIAFISEEDKTLKKLREINTELWNFVIVWLAYYENEKFHFWWTTVISQIETPNLYEDIIKNYKDYLYWTQI
jgi:hypothetical protein